MSAAHYPPDPGKRVRIFYLSRKAGGYVALPQVIAEDLPGGWFLRDDAIEFLQLKRIDMSDAKFAELPAPAQR